MLTDFRPGASVKVYRNLHKKCFSIVDRKTRRVIAHRYSVVILGASFQVREAGRRRVLREKRKNVHAWITGTLAEFLPVSASGKPRRAFYDPYKVSKFVNRRTRRPIEKARVVELNRNGIFYWP